MVLCFGIGRKKELLIQGIYLCKPCSLLPALLFELCWNFHSVVCVRLTVSVMKETPQHFKWRSEGCQDRAQTRYDCKKFAFLWSHFDFLLFSCQKGAQLISGKISFHGSTGLLVHILPRLQCNYIGQVAHPKLWERQWKTTSLCAFWIYSYKGLVKSNHSLSCKSCIIAYWFTFGLFVSKGLGLPYQI